MGVIFYIALSAINTNDNAVLNESSTQASPSQGNNTTVVIQQNSRSNGVGTAGFVLAIVAILLCWVPVLDFILWFLGALLSFIGLFRSPKGLAIAGFVISFIGVIILMAFVGSVFAFLH